MNENKGVPAAVGTLFYRQYHQIAVIFLQSGENLRIFEKNSEKHLIFAKNRDIINKFSSNRGKQRNLEN